MAINYILEYAQAIRQGHVTVGKHIKTIYKKLEDGLVDGFLIYDAKKANKAINFIEQFCHHCESRNDLLKLELWQKAICAAIFGIVDDEGYRQFREVFIVVGRKNGKTLFVSAIIAYMIYIDGEYGAKGYCLAPKLEQSYLLYDNFYQMVLQDADLSAVSKKRRSDIYIAETNSSVRPLAFSSKKSDGFNPHIVACDEAASWIGEGGLKQYEVMKSAFGARREPLILTISTAGYEDDGIYDELTKRSTAVLKGDSKETRLLPFMYTIDDVDKWNDMEELKKSNPNMGVSVLPSFYKEEILIAENSISKRSEFLTKYCNIKQNSSAAWLEYQDVEGALCDKTFEDFRSCYALVGIDLSQTTDLTAVSFVIEKDGILNCFCRFFMPEKRLRIAQADDGVPYDIFVKKGILKICGDSFIDLNIVYEWIEEVRQTYDLYVLQVGYDRYSANYLIQQLEASGYKTDDVFQGENLAPIIRQFEGLLLENRIKICENNALLKAHFLNVALKHNAETRKFRPIKIKRNMRIDGFVSVIDAMTVRDKWQNEYGELLKNES